MLVPKYCCGIDPAAESWNLLPGYPPLSLVNLRRLHLALNAWFPKRFACLRCPRGVTWVWRDPSSAIWRASWPLPYLSSAHPDRWFLSQPSQQHCISANNLGRREPALPFDITNPVLSLDLHLDTFVYPSPDEDDCVTVVPSAVGWF